MDGLSSFKNLYDEGKAEVLDSRVALGKSEVKFS